MAACTRPYRLAPLPTEIELVAVEPNGSAVNGFRYTLGLGPFYSKADREAPWAWSRCRAEATNECRSRTKAIAWVPLRLWQPAARPLKPESPVGSAGIAAVTHIRTPPTVLTTSARPPKPMPM